MRIINRMIEALIILFEAVVYAIFALGSVVGVYLLWVWFWRVFEKRMKDK